MFLGSNAKLENFVISSAVNVSSEWVQTADQNITIIHITPVHQLDENLRVCKKQSHDQDV